MQNKPENVLSQALVKPEFRSLIKKPRNIAQLFATQLPDD
jgi:hypothetical protein